MAKDVTVTFKYTPDEPDENDRTGVSEAEFNRLMDAIAQLGGYDVEIEA